MFTVEIEYDYTKVVSIDEKDEYDDLDVYYMPDLSVTFHQQHEECDPEIITISYQQLLDIVAALNLPSGAYFAKERT